MTDEYALKFKKKWEKETYLGDGLYASFDGYQIMLRATRLSGDHYIALEPDVMKVFVLYDEMLRSDIRKLMKVDEFAESKDAFKYDPQPRWGS